jgi:hypothetical protein
MLEGHCVVPEIAQQKMLKTNPHFGVERGKQSGLTQSRSAASVQIFGKRVNVKLA